jgi:hypothetical protein
MGEFDNAQKALEAGRAMLDVNKIWVGKMEQTYFSDMFIGGDTLLNYMSEDAQGLDDEFYASFERLPTVAKTRLSQMMLDCIGEWESELPDELQFTGMMVKTVKGYPESAMVRKADFLET